MNEVLELKEYIENITGKIFDDFKVFVGKRKPFGGYRETEYHIVVPADFEKGDELAKAFLEAESKDGLISFKGSESDFREDKIVEVFSVSSNIGV